MNKVDDLKPEELKDIVSSICNVANEDDSDIIRVFDAVLENLIKYKLLKERD